MARKWLEYLTSLFPSIAFEPGECELLPASSLPPTHRALLDHHHHMTVTLEEHFGRPVFLHVLEVHSDPDVYARRLKLTAGEDGPVVLAGIMRIELEHVSPRVRETILGEETPLGRILIENDVLRSVQTSLFVRIRRTSRFARAFDEVDRGDDRDRWAYGRLAVIFCDDRPAIELLEVLAM